MTFLENFSLQALQMQSDSFTCGYLLFIFCFSASVCIDDKCVNLVFVEDSPHNTQGPQTVFPHGFTPALELNLFQYNDFVLPDTTWMGLVVWVVDIGDCNAQEDEAAQETFLMRASYRAAVGVDLMGAYLHAVLAQDLDEAAVQVDLMGAYLPAVLAKDLDEAAVQVELMGAYLHAVLAKDLNEAAVLVESMGADLVAALEKDVEEAAVGVDLDAALAMAQDKTVL